MLLNPVILWILVLIVSRITYRASNSCPRTGLLSLTGKEVDRSSVYNSTATVNVSHFRIVNLWFIRLNSLTVMNTSVQSKCNILVINVVKLIFAASGGRRLLRADNFLNMLWMLLSFNQIELLKTFMQLIYVGDWLSNNCFSIVFAKFVCKILFFSRMEKGADLWLVTP